jgi:hypothetical protein
MGKQCPVILLIIIILVSACSGNDISGGSDGPLLLRDVTLPPNTPGQTQNAPFIVVTAFGITPEIVSPLDKVTLPADFVLVTPTLPPSKTPSQTPTMTTEPPPSQTPTVTVTSTKTQPILPTSVIIPVTSVAVRPIDEVCDSTWFFLQPRPESCPRNVPLADQGVYQQFENGYMMWVRRTDAIYILYNDNTNPRWEVFRDYFVEGMPQDFNEVPPASRWEPVRGFGLLWRNNLAVRNRIGWATQQQETPYSVKLQMGDDNAIFLNDPSGNIFGLVSDRNSWALYAGR